eukprot:COSAG02_NODE_15004_length_1215_cov_1.352151_2_plen_181_part_00
MQVTSANCVNDRAEERGSLLDTARTPGDPGSRDCNSLGGRQRLVLRSGKTRRVVLLEPRLFLRKAVLVVVGSYALIPLLAYKSTMPAGLYLTLLLVIHVAVLVVYCYRVKLRSLDIDRVSLGARVLGLLVVTWMLSAVSGWQDHDQLLKLAAQMLVLCAVHTVALALLMVAVEPVEQVGN